MKALVSTKYWLCYAIGIDSIARHFEPHDLLDNTEIVDIISTTQLTQLDYIPVIVAISSTNNNYYMVVHDGDLPELKLLTKKK